MKRLLILLSLILVELVGLGFFVKGFFPYKKSIPGFATRQEQPADLGQLGSHVDAQYDRLVVMLVDALRNDFVFGNNSGMAYTQSLLRDGRAVGYTAKALAPTVTMPRIKALMTGTVPNFLDAVLNIAESDTSSSLKFHDNLLWQLKNHGNKTINMFGDDTWLRLFPDIFSRTDGTSSFFVTDTVEVDLNVTRHVKPDLEKDDWDVTVLHYLGLDHIGHLAGPDSPLMKPKQQEMDRVVQQVNEIIQRQDAERLAKDKSAKPTLFVLLGDHAMNEIGNHGGNSKLETSTVFVFMGQGIQGQPIADKGKNALSRLLTKEVPQIDLVPTLALLFGVPIPKNNLGLPLVDMLSEYSEGELLRLLQLSAFQMFGVVRANDPSVADVDMQMVVSNLDAPVDCDSVYDNDTGNNLRCKYMRALAAHHIVGNTKGADAKAAVRRYYQFMEHANEHLSRTFSGYDLEAMCSGILFIGIATAGLFLLTKRSLGLFSFFASTANWPAVGMVVTYAASVASSSLIEEEHQYWYFWVQTMLVLRLVTSSSKGSLARTLLQMCLFRVARAWNQTGQKWAGELDIRHYLNTTYTREMWLLAIMAALWANVWIYRLQIYLYPRPSRERITGPIDEVMRHSRPSTRTHKASAHLMAYRRDHELSERRKVVEESARRVVTLYTGVETTEQRMLVLGQRVLRALVAYASTCALVYHLDRNAGWEALGLDSSTWDIIRLCAPPDLANVARMVYMCTGVAGIAGTACAWWRARSGFDGQNPCEEQATLTQAAALDTLATITPLLMLLSRPHNIAVFALFTTIFALFDGRLVRLWALRGSWIQKAEREDHGRAGWRPTREITVFCLLNASFYVLGNSNSLASLDLSNAYAGVSRYNENLVGVLLFVANWAGPLWWAAAGLCVLSFRKPAAADRVITDALASAHLWQACALLLLSIVVTSLRTHLFIWSVFSPRYLYQIGWLVGFYTVSLTLGGIAWVTGFSLLSLK